MGSGGVGVRGAGVGEFGVGGLESAELWLGDGIRKVGVGGGVEVRGVGIGGLALRGLRSGELKSRGWSKEDWGRRSCGWGMRSEELGSRRLELGGLGSGVLRSVKLGPGELGLGG